MSTPTNPHVGGIPSADIAVPEHAKEVRFYASILTTGAAPLWRDDLMNNQGTPIIGLGERTPEYEKLPLQWMAHIQVADVAASVAKTLELGGEELWHGKDEAGASQWAALRDPGGAAFGVIRAPKESEPAYGPPAEERAGRIAGTSLTVPDAASACAFYREVIGWTVRTIEQKDGEASRLEFEMLDGRGDLVATICAAGADPELPNIWLLTLPVEDLAASLRHVEDGSGEVLRTQDGADGAVTSAIVRDPIGVCFALIQA